jgi:ABC-type branched-subunit amino acid transport system ATPase component
MSTVLGAYDVTHSFGGVQAVCEATIEIPAGTIVGLIGPNGAGKSTLLAVIGGALRAQSGQLRFQDEDITSWPVYRRAQAGLVRTFQLGSEFGRLTVLDNLLLGRPSGDRERLIRCFIGRGRWKAEEREALNDAERIAEDFSLTSLLDEYAANLSGGQKRLLELGRALMAQPRVLLLDEPMVGINPVLREELIARLSAIRSTGISALVVEHELDVVDQLCDVVYVMAAGRILRHGVMAELRRDQDVIEAYIGA